MKTKGRRKTAHFSDKRKQGPIGRAVDHMVAGWTAIGQQFTKSPNPAKNPLAKAAGFPSKKIPAFGHRRHRPKKPSGGGGH